MKNTVSLGVLVMDRLSKFTGIASSRVEMMGGNVQYAVQPQLNSEAKPGEFPDAMSIDAHTLEFVGPGLSADITAAGPTTVELGDKVKDIVTGLIGIAVSRVTFMNGCIYYNVQPPIETDKQTGMQAVPAPSFLNQQRLEVVKPKVAPVPTPTATTSGRVPGGPSTRAQRAS